MPTIDWDAFRRLPGSPEYNFEALCRAIVRKHYSRYGRFKQLANQPGVEFHLELTSECDLGAPPVWFGWQCKWYEIDNGTNLGSARKKIIREGIEKTQRHVPGITHWALWTRHTLTASDQQWFYGLRPEFPDYELSLLTSEDIEQYLNGPAALLRECYFGQLALTPNGLAEQYNLAAAPFAKRYQPEVHIMVQAEKAIYRALGNQSDWEELKELQQAIRECSAKVAALTEDDTSLKVEIDSFLLQAKEFADRLTAANQTLDSGNFDELRQVLDGRPAHVECRNRLLAKLRKARSRGAIWATNLLAHLHATSNALSKFDRATSARVIAIHGAAGRGKSELCAKITQPDGDFPGGILFLGKNLFRRQTLDDLAKSFKISGRPVESFTALAEALNATGARAKRRLPIVIDGLNESEDSRDWKDLILGADELLKNYPYVVLIVTLRTEFLEDSTPDDISLFEHDGFGENTHKAIAAYCEYYRIDTTDADLSIGLLSHPLTLRIFCEVANPKREATVGVEALPNSLTQLFERHIDGVAQRIADARLDGHRFYPNEVNQALLRIAALLWKSNQRMVAIDMARREIQDPQRWDHSLIRALESEGVLIRHRMKDGQDGISFAYDLLAGYMMARHLVTQPKLKEWLPTDDFEETFGTTTYGKNTYARDTFTALVSLYPQQNRGEQIWKTLRHEQLKQKALSMAFEANQNFIDQQTVDRVALTIQQSDTFAKNAFDQIRSTRAARGHKFDANFLTRVLNDFSNTKRDLLWSEWLRRGIHRISSDIIIMSAPWASGQSTGSDVQRAQWIMWTLTSTSKGLRDRATRALYQFCLLRPHDFFQLSLQSISISDPYVPERMFAAAYGAALSARSNEDDSMLKALPGFARAIYTSMFAPDAPYPTSHALYRQYCLGIIDIAREIDPSCFSDDEATHLLAPFGHLPEPFSDLPVLTSNQADEIKRSAIRMDFGNYTLGRLIPESSWHAAIPHV